MTELPLTLWQHFLEGSDASRFSVGLPGTETQELGLESNRFLSAPGNSTGFNGSTALEPLESLRADVLVMLYNDLTAASIAHPQLAPVLMDALDCALESLQLFTNWDELCEVQKWLSRGEAMQVAQK